MGPFDMPDSGLDPKPTIVALTGHVGRVEVPDLVARVRRLLAVGGSARVFCDVAAVPEPDVETLDVLAQLQLAARRKGGQLLLRNPSRQLQELLVLTGFCDVLPVCPGSACGVGRQTEQWEQPFGVQEGDHPADPVP